MGGFCDIMMESRDQFCYIIQDFVDCDDAMPFMTFPKTTLPHGVDVVDWAIGDAPLRFDNGLAAAIGNFDGVHLGHQHLIKAAMADGKTPAVITFAPHPRRFFSPVSDGFYLCGEADKLAFIASLGVRVILRLTFNDAMRNTSAEDFITKVLPALGVQALYAGEDFGFGNNRSGGMDMIDRLGRDHGISTHPVAILQEDQDAISSTRIRGLISQGEMAQAAAMLGRPFAISGAIIKGDQRGRTIGFPTANMTLDEMTKPAFGVYSIAMAVPKSSDGDQAPKIYPGVANLGIRPTAPDRGVLLESHLFGYDGDLYDQRVSVFLLDFIRPERAFDNFDQLREQIALDAESAKRFHLDHTGLLSQ